VKVRHLTEPSLGEEERRQKTKFVFLSFWGVEGIEVLMFSVPFFVVLFEGESRRRRNRKLEEVNKKLTFTISPLFSPRNEETGIQ